MRSLHNEIMKIPVGGKGVSIAREALTDSGGVHIAYKIGHRDARHAAAELANKYDDNHERLVEALDKCVAELERNTCLHEETYRAGVLWEVCSHCGHKWADDEGGKPEFMENPVVEEVRTLLAALEAEKGGEL